VNYHHDFSSFSASFRFFLLLLLKKIRKKNVVGSFSSETLAHVGVEIGLGLHARPVGGRAGHIAVVGEMFHVHQTGGRLDEPIERLMTGRRVANDGSMSWLTRRCYFGPAPRTGARRTGVVGSGNGSRCWNTKNAAWRLDRRHSASRSGVQNAQNALLKLRLRILRLTPLADQTGCSGRGESVGKRIQTSSTLEGKLSHVINLIACLVLF